MIDKTDNINRTVIISLIKYITIKQDIINNISLYIIFIIYLLYIKKILIINIIR